MKSKSQSKSQSKSKAESNVSMTKTKATVSGKTELPVIKCRGLYIRHSRMFFVTEENHLAYQEASKNNEIWSGSGEIEESILSHHVSKDPRISLYLRPLDALTLDKHDPTGNTLVAKVSNKYKDHDLIRDLKHQSDIPLKDCLKLIQPDIEQQHKPVLKLRIEAGNWIMGCKSVYVTAQSLVASYEAWEQVDFMEPKKILQLCSVLNVPHPYYARLLQVFRQKAERLTISEAAVLQNIYAFIALYKAGREQLLYERDLEIERSTSYIHNPVIHKAS